MELPYINDKEILFAEFRRLSELRHKTKSKENTKVLRKSEKQLVFEKTSGFCHICGEELDDKKISISTPFNKSDSVENSLPACQSCKRLFGNHLSEEINWIIKIGMWARTQIEFETDIGLEIATELIESEKDREQRRKESRLPYFIDKSKYPVKINPFVGKSTKIEYKKIKDVLFWSYSNLAMAYRAKEDETERYNRNHFAIRQRLFKGLMSGKMNIGSLFHDEKSKLNSNKCCVYCGKTRNLQLDHIIPRNKGGKDTGENLVWACRKCNASKNDTDLMEWMTKQGKFPSLHILRNYMKLVIQYCQENDILEQDVDTACGLNLPFAVEYVPLKYPEPIDLIYRLETDNNAL